MIKQSTYLRTLKASQVGNMSEYTRAWLKSAVDTLENIPPNVKDQIDDLMYDRNRIRQPLEKCRVNASLHILTMVLNRELELDGVK